ASALGEVLAPVSLGLTMGLDEPWISLLLMVGTMMLVGGCRKLTRRQMHSRRLQPRTFLLELFATFQICACTNELRLLANVQPKPHVALTLTYVFTVLHGLTLTGSTCNPCGTLQQILDGGISVKQGGLKIGAQFAGAVLARIYMHRIWSMGIIKVHSEALAEGCSNPIQTTETQAFCIELLFSTVFQLTILQFEAVKPRLRVHLIALLITMLVYGGYHSFSAYPVDEKPEPALGGQAGQLPPRSPCHRGPCKAKLLRLRLQCWVVGLGALGVCPTWRGLNFPPWAPGNLMPTLLGRPPETCSRPPHGGLDPWLRTAELHQCANP
uniref:Aquaporin 11 n=2 Tax=Terrapene triunguis TaxID=2587831 RepID=A0A674JVM9_9SAUR